MMKTLKYFLFGILLTMVTMRNAHGDDYPTILGIGGDKYLHFGVSAGLTAGLYFTMSGFTGREVRGRLPCLIAASGFAFGIGLAKEVMDADGGNLDGGDLAADALGVAATAITIYLLDIHGKKDKGKTLQIGFTGRKAWIGWRF